MGTLKKAEFGNTVTLKKFVEDTNDNIDEINARVQRGFGSPEGVIVAGYGTKYEDSSNGDTYVKTTLTTSSGWKKEATQEYVNNSIEEHASATGLHETYTLKEQCINSINGITDTTSIFDITSANLTGNLLKAGIKFNTVIDGLKYRYYLSENVPIPAMEANKLYFPVLKIKENSKYKRVLIASDVDIILLNQEMLWKNMQFRNATFSLNSAIPTMSSSSQGGWILNSNYSPSIAYLMTDGSDSTTWSVAHGSADGNPTYPNITPSATKPVYIYITAPTTQTTWQYTLGCKGTYYPSTWKIEYSSDGGSTFHTTQNVSGAAKNYTGACKDGQDYVAWNYIRITVTAAYSIWSGSVVNYGLDITSMVFYQYDAGGNAKVPYDLQNMSLQVSNGSTITDKFNNSIAIDGNPTISNGKLVCDGTGDGLKISTITTLGNDKWIIQRKIKRTTAGVIQYVVSSKKQYGFALRFNAANKLELYLSSNGTSHDIIAGLTTGLGTKTDWGTTAEYYLRIRFTGTQYIVEWSIDGSTWSADITHTSSVKVYSDIISLLLNLNYDENTLGLIGTSSIADDKVCIGNDYFQDSGRFYYNGENVYIGYPSGYIPINAVPALMLGELTTNGTQVSNAITYAFNRKIVLTSATLPAGSSRTAFTSNMGIKKQTINYAITCNIADATWLVGDRIPNPFIEYNQGTYITPTSPFINTRNDLLMMQYTTFYIPTRSGTVTYAAPTLANWSLEIVVEGDN